MNPATNQFLMNNFPWLFELKHLIPNLTFTTVMVFVFIGARLAALKLVLSRAEDSRSRLSWRRSINYVTFLIFILILFPVWLPALKPFTTFLGLFGAGIVIIFKEVFLNIAGWAAISLRKPFLRGNRIQVGNDIGEVLDLRLLDFTMLEVNSRDHGGQSTGRVIHVPNAKIFTESVRNASMDLSLNWNEIVVPITTKSDWRKAVRILEDLSLRVVDRVNHDDPRIKRAEEELAIHYAKLDPAVYVEVKGNAILLTLRHLVEPRNIRNLTDRLWREILGLFEKEPDIEITYPED